MTTRPVPPPPQRPTQPTPTPTPQPNPTPGGGARPGPGLVSPQIFDIRTFNADDLIFFLNHTVFLKQLVGPTKVVNMFYNWAQEQGGGPPSIAASQAVDRIRAKPREVIKGYNGPLKKYVPHYA